MSRQPFTELALCDRRRVVLLSSLDDVRIESPDSNPGVPGRGYVQVRRVGAADGLNLAVAYHRNRSTKLARGRLDAVTECFSSHRNSTKHG
jgi:hypothetical protein